MGIQDSERQRRRKTILYVGPLSAHEFWSCEQLVCRATVCSTCARYIHPIRAAAVGQGVRRERHARRSIAHWDSRLPGPKHLPCDPRLRQSDDGHFVSRVTLCFPRLSSCYSWVLRETGPRIVSRQRGLGKHLLCFLKPRLPLIAQTPYDVGIVQRVLHDALEFTYRGKELAVWHLLVLAAP